MAVPGSGIWTVHSEAGGMPGLRGFAKTKADADALMARVQHLDADAGTKYWLLELTIDELEDFREAGILPENDE
jgi:hypothetical protein